MTSLSELCLVGSSSNDIVAIEAYFGQWAPLILIVTGCVFLMVNYAISNLELIQRIHDSNENFSRRIEKVKDEISNLSENNYLREVTTMIQIFRDDIVSNGWDVQVLSVRNIYDRNGDQKFEFSESMVGKRQPHEPAHLFLLHSSHHYTKKKFDAFLESISIFQRDTLSSLDASDKNASILYRMMANRIAIFSPNKKGDDFVIVPVIISPHIDTEVMKALECEEGVSYVTANENLGYTVVLRHV